VTNVSVLPGQEPLLDAARIQFAGMSMDSLEEPPDLDDVMTFEVKATCTGVLLKRMKDGELRRVRIMHVNEVTPLGEPAKPETPPNLFDADGAKGDEQ
jgi:hypothetical protein